jgi:glycosyltransferase involved in cell wall biosynthesis
MTSPLVSACIPAFNRAGYLRESLASIQRQDYTNLEILISDNCSTDDTEAFCAAEAAKDPRIRYVRQPRNIGMHANHNFLIEESRGEYFGFFHDDDVYQPNIVSTYVKFLREHWTVGLVCSDWGLIDEHGRAIGARRHAVPSVTRGYDYIERTLRSGQSSLGCPGVFVRRSTLGDARFDPKGSIGFSDFATWFQVAEHADIGHVGTELWRYRLHNSSASRRTITSVAHEYHDTLSAYCDRYLRRRPEDTERAARWRQHINRFLFWALAYEVGLAFRQSSESDQARYRTVFEIADYHLDAGEIEQTLLGMKKFQHGSGEQVVRTLVVALVRARWTTPLRWAARYPLTMRRLLGIR